MRHESARAVALRILDSCFAGADARAAARDLAPFQAHALHRLRTIIDHRGGAILADSVGLGKTHVAVALVRETVDAGECALVVAPAQLRAHWTRHLRGLPRCRWISHTALSRGTRRVAAARLIVVDEAHAFRNPRARRYAALAMLCADARVLLVTATPVNNSLHDFYHLTRLFAARDLFADIGVPDLFAAVESAVHGGSGAELRRIADAVMVRRTRRAATMWQSGETGLLSCDRRLTPGERRLRFPTSGPIEVVRYDLRADRPDLLERVQHVVPSLTFPAHCIDRDAVPRELMRLGLLKRLESSTWALRTSVNRHIRLLDLFVAAAQDALLFDPRRDLVQNGDVDGAMQLSLDALTLRPWPRSTDRVSLIDAARRDASALRELAEVVSRTVDATEPKLLRLRDLLDGCDGKVLLFTEYRETARGLWAALATRPGVALVHGSDARLGRGRSGRRAVIERFAPIANHARMPREAEHVRLLIATDVLAEGMNLQDAEVVVSYDLPWNPVRLAQRIGRIDRLGSPHAAIRAIAFAPDRGVDELLGLMKRIRRKLHHIRVVGGDAPWSLARASTRWLAAIDAAGEARERVYALWRSSVQQCAASPAAPSHGVALGTLEWRQEADAALCCFRTGSETLLVLTSDASPPRIGSAECWSILGDALAGGDEAEKAEPPCVPPREEGEKLTDADAATLRTAARSAARVAARVLRPRRYHPRSNAGETGAALACAAVMRWLADRPVAPSTEELEVADAILRQLRAGGRAGADARLRSIMRSAPSTDAAVKSLVKLLEDRAAVRRHPGNADRDGEATAAGADHPRRPELIAVLLLRGQAGRTGCPGC